MLTFEVNDMRCGHCVGSITQAVRAIDPQAQVSVELATHRVRIQPIVANPSELSQAIGEAGFSPVPLTDDATQTEQAPPRSACGCGCR